MNSVNATNSVNPTRLAIVGIGKIARDQHIPSISRNPAFTLAAAVSRHALVQEVENYKTLVEMLNSCPDVSAVVLCTPPQVRFELAWAALQAGKHVMLEKPPGATLSEVEILRAEAVARGLTLYATWHSQHAAGVAAARDWLARRRIIRLSVVWKEDVRQWHPGQAWIWKAGNAGVFDPGINALSILTRILPARIRLKSADLEFPSNCETPIAATLRFVGPSGSSIVADFDWRHTGDPAWDIHVETDDGELLLSGGGSEMQLDGKRVEIAPVSEYDSIYSCFAELLAAGQSNVDLTPLQLVADAFMLGRRHLTNAFHE